jgi:hypothetical protein
MNERIQDQRPVYMGTFSKYTRAFEARIAIVENDVEYHKRTLRTQTKKIQKLEKIMKYTIIANSVLVLAMIMHTIFS